MIRPEFRQNKHMRSTRRSASETALDTPTRPDFRPGCRSICARGVAGFSDQLARLGC